MKPDLFQDGPLREAVRAMFNGQLESSESQFKGYMTMKPRDPLGCALSVAVPFYHFVGNRMQPHGSGTIKDLIVGKGIAVPPDFARTQESLLQARRLAEIDLDADPRDQNAMLALSIVEGVERDALVLFHKRWMDSLKHAQAAGLHAKHLLEVNAKAYDAYYVVGLSEYVIAQIPAFLRPFAKIPGIVGRKSRAIDFLEAAAGAGCYLQDFARQMLVTIYLEEGRKQDAVRLLESMAGDFPDNTGYGAELARLKA